MSGEAFGFRRRCGWCGVVLRAWQLNLCRVCRFYVRYDHPSPPCVSGSRWDAQPDPWTPPRHPTLSDPKEEQNGDTA